MCQSPTGWVGVHLSVLPARAQRDLDVLVCFVWGRVFDGCRASDQRSSLPAAEEQGAAWVDEEQVDELSTSNPSSPDSKPSMSAL